MIGQLISVGGGLAAGTAVYAYVVLAMRLPEAEQLRRLIAGRLGRATAWRPGRHHVETAER